MVEQNYSFQHIYQLDAQLYLNETVRNSNYFVQNSKWKIYIKYFWNLQKITVVMMNINNKP